jgi:hypothetical protein
MVDFFAPNGTGQPVEYVKTRCPALIAALVSIARANKTSTTHSDRRPRGESSAPGDQGGHSDGA